MSHGTSRILTTHVGSLIRPPELLALIEAKQDGTPVDDAVFADRLRQSVADIVHQQAAVGIDIVSDGEFGKTGSWSRYVVERLIRRTGTFRPPGASFDHVGQAACAQRRRRYRELYSCRDSDRLIDGASRSRSERPASLLRSTW